MPVPTSIDDLSTIASENSPSGSESAKGSIDNYFRSHASFIAVNRDAIAALPTDSDVSTAVTNGVNGLIPSGTKMLFIQSTAPTGWTKVATHDNKALRIVSGTAGSGGSVAFTTAFASKAVSGTVGGTAITEAQMPAHYHLAGFNPEGGIGWGGAYYGAEETGLYVGRGVDEIALGGTSSPKTSTVGGGQAHNHSFTGTAINMAVQYVDAIICTRN